MFTSKVFLRKAIGQRAFYYKVNDVVKFGNVQYRVTTAHTSAGTFIDLTKVTEYVAGLRQKENGYKTPSINQETLLTLTVLLTLH